MLRITTIITAVVALFAGMACGNATPTTDSKENTLPNNETNTQVTETNASAMRRDIESICRWRKAYLIVLADLFGTGSGMTDDEWNKLTDYTHQQALVINNITQERWQELEEFYPVLVSQYKDILREQQRMGNDPTDDDWYNLYMNYVTNMADTCIALGVTVKVKDIYDAAGVPLRLP